MSQTERILRIVDRLAVETVPENQRVEDIGHAMIDEKRLVINHISQDQQRNALLGEENGHQIPHVIQNDAVAHAELHHDLREKDTAQTE